MKTVPDIDAIIFFNGSAVVEENEFEFLSIGISVGKVLHSGRLQWSVLWTSIR